LVDFADWLKVTKTPDALKMLHALITPCLLINEKTLHHFTEAGFHFPGG